MRVSGALLVASLLSGCGYKKEIEAFERMLADADRTAVEQAAQVTAMEGSLAALQAALEEQAADLGRQIAAKDAEIADAEAALSDEQEKSSRILADRGSLRSEVASMKDALADLRLRKKAAEARVQAFRELVSRFQSLIDSGTLDVKIVDGRMVVVLATDVLFSSGSASLSPDGKEAIAQVAGVLGGIEERQFQVEGHTDDIPIRTDRYPSNWYLAAARAIGVVEHLTESGMQPDHVSAAAYGDTRPIAPNKTPEGREQNRRIEIVVVPDLSALPGYDELAEL